MDHSGRPSERPPRGGGDVASLVEEEITPMVRMATLMLGSAAQAEEVVQDAFAGVVQRWDGIDRPGAYLRRSVVNGCAQVLRRRELEARHAALEAPVDHVELPSHLLELRLALATLPARQRIVIVLRYFVDLPDRDIAALIEARPATVRSLARRALASLREELR